MAGKNALYLYKGSTWVIRSDENIRSATAKIMPVDFAFGGQLAMSSSSTPTISS
jgi:hypothetical protein